MIKTDLESVRRVARIYASNKDAATALGIDTRSFARICRKKGIETPETRLPLTLPFSAPWRIPLK